MNNADDLDSVSGFNVAQLDITPNVEFQAVATDRRRYSRLSADMSPASAALLRLFNELAYGIIVVDANRQVVHINRAARGALAREQRLRVRGQALEAWRERDAKVFAHALDTAFSGRRAAMRIGECKDSGQSNIILVPLPAPASTSALNQSQIGHIALMFERSACTESLSIAFYAQNHGLTSGEERVLRALNDDQSVVEVANALGTAISTIRTHVNHIREKTGARSLRALMANLRSVPPLMPAVGD